MVLKGVVFHLDGVLVDTSRRATRPGDAVATARSPLEPLDDRLQHRVADPRRRGRSGLRRVVGSRAIAKLCSASTSQIGSTPHRRPPSTRQSLCSSTD
jgi:phosphoglycolate phosphatase-like HAD superfamily hydrolase